MRKINLFKFLLICFLFVSCASTPKENFEKIQVGMYKGDLLDMAGSPVNSEFRNGEYIWTYRYFENDKKIEKEVRIKNDSVVYVGDIQKPKSHAFDQVKVGMEKSAVLDLVGFPKRVEKVAGTEVWTFVDEGVSKSLVMDHGKVKGLGVPPKEATKEDGKDDKASEAAGFIPIEE